MVASVIRIAFVLALMLATVSQVAAARPTLPTAFGHAYVYDDHRLCRDAATTAEPVPFTPQSVRCPGRLATSHVYDSLRRQVLRTFQKSSGKERDGETGLDYFGARYFSGAQGRFTSPDAPFADQFVEDPQSWNLYAYVRNNPVVLTDPDGRAVNFLAAAGAGIVGFGVDVGFQVFGEGKKLSEVNFRRSAGVGTAAAVTVASFGILAPAATSATLVTVAGETSLQVGSALALQTGPAVVSGVVGGAVGKVVETGNPSRALGDTPLEPVANGVGAVVGNVAQAAGNAVVGSTRASGALRELQRQSGRAQAPSLQRKLEGRISGRAADVARQQRVANTTAQASTEASAQIVRKRIEEDDQNR